MFHNLARGAGQTDGSREVEMRASRTSYPHKKIETPLFRMLLNDDGHIREVGSHGFG